MQFSCCIPPDGKGLATFWFLALAKFCQIWDQARFQGFHNTNTIVLYGAGYGGEFDSPDSEVSVFDSRSLSEASRMLAFSSLMVSWGKISFSTFRNLPAVAGCLVGLQVHLGRDFPCAVHLLLLRQSGDRRPAGGSCRWMLMWWATTKNANWAQATANRGNGQTTRGIWATHPESK